MNGGYIQRKWSKVKNLESLTCESLKGRVDFFVTNYRKAHDQLGRAYITVDKEEVFSMCSIKGAMVKFRKERELLESLNVNE